MTFKRFSILLPSLCLALACTDDTGESSDATDTADTTGDGDGDPGDGDPGDGDPGDGDPGDGDPGDGDGDPGDGDPGDGDPGDGDPGDGDPGDGDPGDGDGDPGGDEIVFAALGDVPYDDSQAQNLAFHIDPALNMANLPFILHYGDWKGQPGDCDQVADDYFTGWIAARTAPVFYTPGDNEWTDCDLANFQDNPVSELGRLDTIRNLYFAAPPNAPQLFPEVQAEQVENQSWMVTVGQTTVVFGTIHLVGTRNGRINVFLDDPAEANLAADTRDANNIAWIDAVFDRAELEGAAAVVIGQQADPTPQANFNEQCTSASNDLMMCNPYLDVGTKLAERAEAFDGPVLLVHGDTPDLCVEDSYLGVTNLWRINGPGDHVLTDALEIRITPSDDIEPFTSQSLRWGVIPAPCQ